MRSGDVTVRRVDPSRIVHGRYEHPDANKREQPPDQAQEGETDREEERKNHAAPPLPPPDDEATVPRLLANRPVLRWLRTGDEAGPSSTFDRFLPAPDDEAPQRKLADHLAERPQSSLQAMLARADLIALPDEPTAPASTDTPEDGPHGEAAARYNSPDEPPPPSFDAEG